MVSTQCYGPSPDDPARCAQASVRHGKILGQWNGRDPGVTMKLAGEVLATGEVNMQMYAERANGSVFGRANLSGTIDNGRLDANGSFFSGRVVSFNWRRG
jgi:hypothetical protein